MPSERDFRGRNLRRTSFRGVDLEGADFSGADLRGADFTDAVLRNASLVHARLGVPPLTGWLVLAGSLLLSIVTGVAIGLFADEVLDRVGSTDWRDTFAAITLGGVVLAFMAVFVRKGAMAALRVYLIVFSVVLVLDFVVVFLVAGELRLRQTLGLIVLFLLFAPAAVAGAVGRIVGGTFGSWALILVAAIGGIAAGRAQGGIAALLVMMLLVFVSRRALKLDTRDVHIRRLAHQIVSRRGTRFTGADISNADFKGTLVAQSDLSHAMLAGARWDEGRGPSAFLDRDPDPS